MKVLNIILSGLMLSAMLHAEEQTTTVRIIGISEPSRVDDLREAIKTLPELQLVNVDADKATAILRYDVVTLLGKAKPKPEEITPTKIIERIDNRLGTAGIRTFSAIALTGLSEDKLTKVEIHVGALDCKGCRYGAYIAVAKNDGVERASVEGEILSVWIDASKTNREALEAALKKARVELPTP